MPASTVIGISWICLIFGISHFALPTNPTKMTVFLQLACSLRRSHAEPNSLNRCNQDNASQTTTAIS